MARPYQVVEYSTQWPGLYQSYCEQLVSALPRTFASLHHIGSTSVPGLAAKPVIDILGSVSDIEVLDRMGGALIEMGYTGLGEYGLPGRRYFVLENAGTRLVNLHIFATGSLDVTRHLAFRDYLRRHIDVRDQYALLKRQLYESAPDDLEAYMDGKDAWIKETERKAIEQARNIV